MTGRRLSSAAAFAVAVLLAAMPRAHADDERVAVEPIATGPFHSLAVSGHAEVVLVQGDGEAVEVAASPRRRARIRVRNDDGRLEIEAADPGGWFALGPAARPLRITVRLRTLEALDVSGAIKLSSDGVRATSLAVKAGGATSLVLHGLAVDALRFAATGAVKAELAGRATAQVVAISGAGEYRANDLASERAQVKVSGAGRAIVHATRELDAQVSGAGTVDYLGSPQVRQRISGAGRVKRLSGVDVDVAGRGPVALGAAASVRG